MFWWNDKYFGMKILLVTIRSKYKDHDITKVLLTFKIITIMALLTSTKPFIKEVINK